MKQPKKVYNSLAHWVIPFLKKSLRSKLLLSANHIIMLNNKCMSRIFQQVNLNVFQQNKKKVKKFMEMGQIREC